jgi:hypothetical protein
MHGRRDLGGWLICLLFATHGKNMKERVMIMERRKYDDCSK